MQKNIVLPANDKGHEKAEEMRLIRDEMQVVAEITCQEKLIVLNHEVHRQEKCFM